MQPYFKRTPQTARQPNQHQYQDQPYSSRPDLIEEKKQIEEILKQKQMEFLIKRQREYESQLRQKQSLGQNYLNKYEEGLNQGDEAVQNYHRQLQLKLLEDNRIRQDIIFQGHLKRYLELKQESKILNSRRQYLHSSLDPLDNSSKIKYKMTIDDNLAYQNERFVKQYQEELHNKINKGKKITRKNHNNKRLSVQSNISSLGKATNRFPGKENIVKNKNTIQPDDRKDKKRQKKMKKDNVKDKLNSIVINNGNHKKNSINSSFVKSKQTLDMSSIQASFAKSKNEKLIDRKMTKTTKISCQSNERQLLTKKSKADNKIKIVQQNIHPLIRIQNRLKLSMIVFADSKMKNKIYELSHLLNTYQAQIRIRKNLKDRINSHLIGLHKRTISHSIR